MATFHVFIAWYVWWSPLTSCIWQLPLASCIHVYVTWWYFAVVSLSTLVHNFSMPLFQLWCNSWDCTRLFPLFHVYSKWQTKSGWRNGNKAILLVSSKSRARTVSLLVDQSVTPVQQLLTTIFACWLGGTEFYRNGLSPCSSFVPALRLPAIHPN